MLVERFEYQMRQSVQVGFSHCLRVVDMEASILRCVVLCPTLVQLGQFACVSLNILPVFVGFLGVYVYVFHVVIIHGNRYPNWLFTLLFMCFVNW